MRLLFLRLFSVALACGSLVFWFKTVKILHAPDSRRLLLLAGLATIFFPSFFYDLARVGNDSLAALLFAGSYYYFLSTYINKQARLSDFAGLALTLGLGVLVKLFFVPILVGTIIFSLWFGVRISKLTLRPVLLRLSLLVGVPLLLAGWWFGFCYVRYGMMITSVEAYMFQHMESPPGDHLTSMEFVVAMFRAFGGFVTTFLWSGSWSWVRPPLYLFVCFVPLLALSSWRLMAVARGPSQMARRQIMVAGLFLLVPLLLGFVFHMYLRVKLSGIGMGTGGYYLFFAWPVVGIWFGLSFDAQGSFPLKVFALSAFMLVSLFELVGWWTLAQVYSGIVEKVGDIKTGIGYLTPTMGNVALVFDRLRALAFPEVAVILYLGAVVLRSALGVWIIFFLPTLGQNPQR
jgi:hypothetical protein